MDELFHIVVLHRIGAVLIRVTRVLHVYMRLPHEGRTVQAVVESAVLHLCNCGVLQGNEAQ